MLNVKLSYNDVKMFSIESVKKTKVNPDGTFVFLTDSILSIQTSLKLNLTFENNYASRFLNQNDNITNSLASKVLIWIFFIFWVSKESIGVVVFCIRDYISRNRIRSILMEFLETSNVNECQIIVWSFFNLRWRSIISKLEKSLK